jgi:hypothetical protein
MAGIKDKNEGMIAKGRHSSAISRLLSAEKSGDRLEFIGQVAVSTLILETEQRARWEARRARRHC